MTENFTASVASNAPTVLPVVGEIIGIKPGFCGGEPHILGHRIKVQQIAIWHERLGLSVDTIVVTYPTVSLAAVYAALAYYHAHRAEIDTGIEADEKFSEEMKAKTGPSKLQVKLAEIRAQNDSVSH